MKPVRKVEQGKVIYLQSINYLIYMYSFYYKLSTSNNQYLLNTITNKIGTQYYHTVNKHFQIG